jgi:hypothetical protein
MDDIEPLWIATGIAVALVVVSGVAEWRRTHRRNLNKVGWIPWRGIQVASFFATIILAALSLKA